MEEERIARKQIFKKKAQTKFFNASKDILITQKRQKKKIKISFHFIW